MSTDNKYFFNETENFKFQKFFDPVLANCDDVEDASCSLVDEDCADCGDGKMRQAWTKAKQQRALGYVVIFYLNSQLIN